MPTLVELPEDGVEETEMEPVQELKEWLYDEVGDDDDIIIDQLQEELTESLDLRDEQEGIKGSEVWNEKQGQLVVATPQNLGLGWEWDGIRKCRVHGKKNAFGIVEGEGGLMYEDKDTFMGVFFNGIENRKGVHTYSSRSDDTGVEKIEGEWINGLLNGDTKAHMVNTGWMEGYYKDGVPHGFFREFGPRWKGRPTLRMVGRHYKGVKRGIIWKGMWDRSGWIVGKVDDKGAFTGDDIAYIYPDMKMAIRGEFKDEKLVSGQVCELLGVEVEDGIKKPVFSECSGKVYEYENPTIRNIADHPLLRDPWETERIYVDESELPQGGEGLFAKKDFVAGDIVALYNGIKIKTSTYASEHMPHSDYRIRLNGDIDMDIPNGYHKISQYCATLAHKANHTFSPNCEWTLYEHPRFGLIRSLTARIPIKKDEEILVNYQMCLAKSPEWYRCVWIAHMRVIKKNDDKAIKRYIDRQYELQGYRIPLPESEVLNVPEPVGVDLDVMPQEYLNPDLLTEEAAVKYAKFKAGLRDQEDDEPRITEVPFEVHG